MSKKQYILATFYLIIFIQIVCIVLIELSISMNWISNININIWRYFLISFVALSMFVLPLLALKAKSKKDKTVVKVANQKKEVYENVISKIGSEVYFVDDKNKIKWFSNNAKVRITDKSVLTNAAFINDKFKLAYDNPGQEFVFHDQDNSYKVIFDKANHTYLCTNITDISNLTYESFINSEVIGFLEVRSIKNDNLEISNQLRKEFKDLIYKWAIQSGIVLTETTSLCFLFHMRQSNLLKMRKEEFAFFKKLDEFLYKKDTNLIIQASFASLSPSTLDNAETARKGMLEIRDMKNTSMIVIQNHESDKLSTFKIGITRSNKSTGVMPGGYSYQNFETVNKTKDKTPIIVSIIANKQNEELNINEHEKVQLQDSKNNENKVKTPDWLKAILEKNASKDANQKLDGNKHLNQQKFQPHSLINEIQQMKKLVCYLENGNKKDEFIISIILYFIAKYLHLDYYIYSEVPFTIHHSIKKEFSIEGFHAILDSIVDAYTLKRLNQTDTFYAIIRKNNFNKEIVNITTNHKIAYIKDSLSKQLLENFISSIKIELKKFDLQINELDILLFLIKKLKHSEREYAFDFFSELRAKKNKNN